MLRIDKKLLLQKKFWCKDVFKHFWKIAQI